VTERFVSHASFTIERRYDATPSRVFAAWSRPESKRRWFACHDDWQVTEFELDFRIGGRERVRTGPVGGTVHALDGIYHDIVPDQRIIYSYDMHLDAAHISVSLATVELRPDDAGTLLLFTEQTAFLDRLYDDPAEREAGTRIGLDNLATALSGDRFMGPNRS
jgi:uncharacterized protein YndB with AHSA1/START domain